ncbi:MAG: hypothetical protein K2X87_03465 [Gemmataceae bacterium]|nr:hypothetical protein [Gemmataceae bacterium]
MEPHPPTAAGLRAVAERALREAERRLPPYSAARSRKDFTQHQLFAVLALRAYLGTDYRGVAAVLRDSPDLRAALGLAKVPHYSTLCYAGRRFGRPDRPCAAAA